MQTAAGVLSSMPCRPLGAHAASPLGISKCTKIMQDNVFIITKQVMKWETFLNVPGVPIYFCDLFLWPGLRMIHRYRTAIDLSDTLLPMLLGQTSWGKVMANLSLMYYLLQNIPYIIGAVQWDLPATHAPSVAVPSNTGKASTPSLHAWECGHISLQSSAWRHSFFRYRM